MITGINLFHGSSMSLKLTKKVVTDYLPFAYLLSTSQPVTFYSFTYNV